MEADQGETTRKATATLDDAIHDDKIDQRQTQQFFLSRSRKKRRRSAVLWKWDRWTLKATSELNLFSNWLLDHEYNPDRLLVNTDTACGVFDVDPALKYNNDSIEIVLRASELPDGKEIVRKRLVEKKDGATDVSCYESNGCLVSFNFAIAQLLIASRKSVRSELNQGPWPANELLINQAITQSRQEARYTHLCVQILERLKNAVHDIPNANACILLRLGLDLYNDERSLVVCATGDSPQEAKQTTWRIWQRILHLRLSPYNDDNH